MKSGIAEREGFDTDLTTRDLQEKYNLMVKCRLYLYFISNCLRNWRSLSQFFLNSTLNELLSLCKQSQGFALTTRRQQLGMFGGLAVTNTTYSRLCVTHHIAARACVLLRTLA